MNSDLSTPKIPPQIVFFIAVLIFFICFLWGNRKYIRRESTQVHTCLTQATPLAQICICIWGDLP